MPVEWTDYKAPDGRTLDFHERSMGRWDLSGEDSTRLIDTRDYDSLQITVIDANGAAAWTSNIRVQQTADQYERGDEPLPTTVSVTTSAQTAIADCSGVAFIKMSPMGTPSTGETVDVYLYAAKLIA